MKFRFLKSFALLFLFTSLPDFIQAEDGYRLWLRYDKIQEADKLSAYQSRISQVVVEGKSATLEAARNELRLGLTGLLGTAPSFEGTPQEGMLLAGTPAGSRLISSLKLGGRLKTVGSEGFVILSTKLNGKQGTVIAANTDVGVLYGVFHFLKLLQTRQDIEPLSLAHSPKTRHRLLNHWDNLDRTVERGYAGFSLWDWHKLPDYQSPRYRDYARANASVGINGTVLTNVNANALILTPQYLRKVAALANIFRPYGIRVYLTARFSAPVELDSLKTADPLDPQVADW
jgi:alpha-glucuronidase